MLDLASIGRNEDQSVEAKGDTSSPMKTQGVSTKAAIKQGTKINSLSGDMILNVVKILLDGQRVADVSI